MSSLATCDGLLLCNTLFQRCNYSLNVAATVLLLSSSALALEKGRQKSLRPQRQRKLPPKTKEPSPTTPTPPVADPSLLSISNIINADGTTEPVYYNDKVEFT